MDYADRLSWRVVFENIMETLSIYLWPIFFSTHYQRVSEPQDDPVLMYLK